MRSLSRLALVGATLLAPAAAQQAVGVPPHYYDLLQGLADSFGTAHQYVSAAQTTADLRTGYALALVDASQVFLATAAQAQQDYGGPHQAPQELIGSYHASAFSLADTALALHLNDLPAARDHWAGVRAQLDFTLKRFDASMTFTDVEAETQGLLEAMDGVDAGLAVAGAELDQVQVFLDEAELIFNADPVAVANSIVYSLNNLPAEYLAMLEWDTPQGLDELIALWDMLTVDPALASALVIAQADPQAWTETLGLSVVAPGLYDLGLAAQALHDALPDPLVQLDWGGGGGCPPDECTTEGEPCSTPEKEYDFGVGAYGPGKFQKAVKAAREALELPLPGGGLPGPFIDDVLDLGDKALEALGGLGKVIGAKRPVPYFRLCAKRCESVDCGGIPFFGPNYLRCSPKPKYTKWKKVPNPDPDDLANPMNPFALGILPGGWGSLDTIHDNKDAFLEAADQGSDDAMGAQSLTDYWKTH